MDEAAPPMPPHPENFRVPEPLMQRLRQANTRFHEARRQLEDAMSDSQYRHQERVNEKEAEFRNAERELEEIHREIQQAMKTIESATSK